MITSRDLVGTVSLVAVLIGIALPARTNALTATGTQYRDEINRVRVTKRVPALSYSYTLGLAALKRVQDMAAGRVFAHSVGGRTYQTYLRTAKVKFSASGEALGMNYGTARTGVAAWLRSSGHRAIILDRRYTHVGAAVGRSVIDGKPTTIVVVLFGRLR